MSGSRPIATNSVVPIANPPMARANTASQRTEGGGETTDIGVGGRSRDLVTRATVAGLRPILKPTLVFLVAKVALLTFFGFNREMAIVGERSDGRGTVGDVFALIRSRRAA